MVHPEHYFAHRIDCGFSGAKPEIWGAGGTGDGGNGGGTFQLIPPNIEYFKCKLCGMDSFAYLLDVLDRVNTHPVIGW